MRIEKTMTKDVATCLPGDRLSTAARIMWDRDCGAVPVVDAGRVVGIITDRDICMAAAMRDLPLSRMRVRDSMRKEPFVCHAGDDVEAAHATMRKRQIRRLPVIDKRKRLVGIVSLNDLALGAARERGGSRVKDERKVVRTLETICEHRQAPAV